MDFLGGQPGGPPTWARMRVVIINQLYIDEFSGHDDLTLEALASGLNVVRVPTAAEAGVLHAFIPSILFGSFRQGQIQVPPLSGAMGAQVKDRSLDLCRLPSAQGTCSTLQILDADGHAVAAESLQQQLQPFDVRCCLALYTDLLPAADQLASWRRAGLLQQLMEPAAVARPSSPDKRGPTQAADRLQQRQTALRGELARLPAPLRQLNTELSGLSNERADYLQLRHQLQQDQQRLRSQSHRAADLERLITDRQLAVELADAWSLQSRLQIRCAELQALQVRRRHARAIEKLEGRMTQIRRSCSRFARRDRQTPKHAGRRRTKLAQNSRP